MNQFLVNLFRLRQLKYVNRWVIFCLDLFIAQLLCGFGTQLLLRSLVCLLFLTGKLLDFTFYVIFYLKILQV